MKSILIAMAAAALACGAPIEGEDIGELEQGFAAKHTLNYQLGVDATPQRMQCTRTNSLQNCSLFTSRTVLFYIESADFGPPGTGYNDEIYAYVDQLDAALPSWTFIEAIDPATPN